MAILRLVMDLQEVRRLRGLTQQQLAEKLGRSQAAVSRLESSRRVSVEALYRYLTACGAERVRVTCELDGKPIELMHSATPS